MITHSQIWTAIDRLAAKYGYSTSGLARQAGLDPTTFNKSKRVAPGGKERWPSTESIAKILQATGAAIGEFIALIDAPNVQDSTARRLPILDYVQAGGGGFFDPSGLPSGNGWDQLLFPNLDDPHAYAIEVSGDSMCPCFPEGSRLIVSPQAQIRAGDRIVVKLQSGAILAKILLRETADNLVLGSFNPEHEDMVLAMGEIAWTARIIWASQ